MNTNLVKFTGKASILWAKHGSKVCMILGIGGAIGAGVLGAKGWHNTELLLDHKKEELDRINKAVEDEETYIDENGDECVYDEQAKLRDQAAIQKSTIKGVIKNLAPAVGLGMASVSLIILGYAQVSKQLTGMTAYASSLKTIIDQRDKIFRKEFGDEKVDMLYAGYRKETVEKTEVDPKTGEVSLTLEEQLVKEFDIPADNIFVFKFQRGCSNWKNNREFNLTQINQIEFSLETLLDTRGFVTVDDVCSYLGLGASDRTAAGQICGVVWKPLPKDMDKRARLLEVDPFEDPMSDVVTLRFKSDGVILSEIDKVRRDYKASRSIR